LKLKLDENLGRRCQELLRSLGHDASTVAAQNLQSASDPVLIERCREEERCLVTLDMDFGNPLVFKPFKYPGIAVLRLRARASHGDLLMTTETLGRALLDADIRGKLWIVEYGRVRVYQPDQ
jgi:predicted nuclease of predicted toxin-antitoxin system